MHRLLVALLSAFDAVLAAAGGIVVVLAPLTLLWVTALGDPQWGALWPATAAVWHLGHLVPVAVTLPDTYLAATGIDPSAATFVLSLAPLAFAVFTAVFAARSGVRGAEAGAALTGWLSGSVAFAAIAAAVAVTSAAPLAASETWQAVLLPSLFFAVPSLIGAVSGAWRVGDDGPVDALRARVAALPRAWVLVPGLVVRGTAVTVVGLVAVGALVFAAALLLRGTQIIGLYQASNVDAVGATVLALGQLTYLPTLVLWGLAFAAGPGFALGTDTAVTPAATQVGVLPGIPVLGAVPESTTSWLLLLALLPVAVGALAGWILRTRLPATGDADPVAPRLTLALGIAVLTGGAGALAAVLSRGAIGPGRLAEVGPAPGALALALGLEVFVGAAILLLSPGISGARIAVVPDEGEQTVRRAALPPSMFDTPESPRPADAAPARPQPSLEPAGRGIGHDLDGWPTAPVPRADAPGQPVGDDEVRARIRDAWSQPEALPGEWGHDGDEPRRPDAPA